MISLALWIIAPKVAYLVAIPENAALGKEAASYSEVAKSAAEFHKGTVISYSNGSDLASKLKSETFDNVLILVPPKMLDLQFHRRILNVCLHQDDDPFADFCFGYLTARNGTQLKKFWERILQLNKNGLASKTWRGYAITSGMKSTIYDKYIPEIAKAAGFSGKTIFFGIREADPNVLDAVSKNLKELNSASVIEMTGNGDPQGTWLFSDQRNREANRHWNFAPEKVGQDPNKEMPRIVASDIRKLELKSPIIWSGVCHSGATCNVFVESDIVSTFGKVDKTTCYTLLPEESFCLAMIDAGAGSLLVPLGPNHGMSVSMEIEEGFTNGLSLGEIMKSTYDDVMFATHGSATLDVPVIGKPFVRNPLIMAEGGLNRALIGDPALRPFSPTKSPAFSIEIANQTSIGFDLIVKRASGFAPRGWDIYGTDRQNDWRISCSVTMPTNKSIKNISVIFSAVDDKGNALGFRPPMAEIENFRNKMILHLQANSSRSQIYDKAIDGRFMIRW